MPRKDQADPNKYADKAYLTYEEAMDYLGIRRSTLYSYITELELPTHKFQRDRRRYLAAADVQKLEQIRKYPWLRQQGGEEEKKQPVEDAA